MPRLLFKKEEPLKFRKMPIEAGEPDEPMGLPTITAPGITEPPADIPGLPDPGTAPAAPPPEPGIPFGAQAVQRAGRIDELTPPVEPPVSFGAQALQRAGRIDELARQEEQPPAPPIPAAPEAPPAPAAPVAPPPRKKGPGFLGNLQRPDGDISTELSIGVEIDGKETEIPTIVPGLSDEEMDSLLTVSDPKKIPKPIVNKAVTHAKQRMEAGLSPFYSPEVDEELGAWDYVKARWMIGKVQTHIGWLRALELTGRGSPEGLEAIRLLKEAMPRVQDAEGVFLPLRALGEAVQFMPLIFVGLEKGVRRGLTLGTGAGVIALASGIGAPAAAPLALGMYGVGMMSGTLENIGMIEAGMAYDEFLDIEDEQGNKINPTIAKGAAGAVGVINGMLELSQIRLLAKTIPGGEALLRGIVRETTKRIMTSGALRQVIARAAGRYTAFVAKETGQEVLQESTNVIMQEFATRLTNHLEGTDLPPQKIIEVVEKIRKTAVNSALGFGVMGLPGAAVTTGRDVGVARTQKRILKFIKESEAPPPEPPGAAGARFEPEPGALPPPILSKDGEPFKTVRGARQNIAKARKNYPDIQNWSIIPFEGGFAIRPSSAVVAPEVDVDEAAAMQGVSVQELFETPVTEAPEAERPVAPEVDPDEVAALEEAEPFDFTLGDTVMTPFGEGKITSIGTTNAIVRLVDGTTEAFDLGDISTPVAREEGIEAVEEPVAEIEPVTPPDEEVVTEGAAGPVLGVDKAGEDMYAGDTVAWADRADFAPRDKTFIIMGKFPDQEKAVQIKGVSSGEVFAADIAKLSKFIEAPAEEVPKAAPVGFDKRGKALRPGDGVEYDKFPGERMEIVGKHPKLKDTFQVIKVGQKRKYNAKKSEIRKIVPKFVKPAPGPQRTWKTLIGWFRLNPIWDRTLPGETNTFHVKNSRIPGLVSEKHGLPWDELAIQAREDGILTEGQDWEDLYEMLVREIGRVNEGGKGTIVGDINVTAQEKQMELEMEADEAEWIAEQATKVEQMSMNMLDLQEGDRVNMPTPQGDSEWFEVNEVLENGDKLILIGEESGRELVVLSLDWMEVVGGEGYGVDRAADQARPDRVALQLDKEQQIPALNSLEQKLIKILNADKELRSATIPVDSDQAKIIDKELWLSNESQKRYGLGSDYDKIGWAIGLVKGTAAGDRVYDIQRPYGYLTFDQEKSLLTLVTAYEDVIDPQVIMVAQDMDKERLTRTTILKDVLNQQPNRTIPNELLQNAFDAMPTDRPWDQKVVKYRVDGRYINGERATVVTFEDNGWGMSAEIFAYKYLKIGAKGKESDIDMGGFGKANAVLLNFPNEVKVVTTAWVRENTKYEETDPRRWQRGQTKRGKVHPSAVKGQVSMNVTQDQLYDSLAGRAEFPINVTLVDRDTPTGTFYEATYTEKDENDNLVVSDQELLDGFKAYVQRLRYKSVVISEGVAGDPDNITHPKTFDDILPEELTVPKKTIKSMGSEIDLYFLDVGKYGAWPMMGRYKIRQYFYNKGLPLQIPTDNISGILRVPFEPEFHLYVNWRKTPEVDEKTYPFIKNRTEVLNKAGDKVAIEVNKVLQKMTDEYMEGQQKDFDQAMSQSMEVEGVTIFLPYREEADVKASKKEINKPANKKMFRSMAKVFNSFNKFLAEVGLPQVNFVITVDPRLHGYKTNPDTTDQEIYAINWFSMTEELLQRGAYRAGIAAGEDPLSLKGRNVATTLLHEFVHKFVKGHEESYTSKQDEILVVFDPFRLSLVAEEAHDIYKQHDKRIESLEKTFKELGEGGLLIEVGSRRDLYAEHEPGTIKGSSATSPVVGSFAASRIQYDLFGEHQKIEAGEEPITPEDFLKRSFPDASPAQIKAMLKDPKLRKQIAQGNIATALAEEISKKYNLAKAVTQMEMFPGEAKGQGDLFDLSRKEVGESVEDWVEKEEPPLGPEGGAWAIRRPKAKAEGKPFESSDEEVQKRVEEARGKKEKTWQVRFKEKYQELKRRAFREFEFLPKVKEWAELRNVLLRLAKAKGIVNKKTQLKIEAIQEGLNETDKLDFAWKVILDDLMEEVYLQSERGTADDDIGLPYGYRPASLAKDHADLTRHIAGNAEVQAALQRRKEFWEKLREDYIKAMKVIGFDVSKFLKREFYFRHQVLNYTNLMGLFGAGDRLRTPSYRSHLRPRTGSDLDINADYLQAEHEVVAQMLYDIEIARTINAVNRYYNIQDDVKARALMLNDAKMLSFFGDLVKTLDVPEGKDPPTAEDLYKQVLNTKMAIGFDKLGQAAAMEELPVGKNFEWEWLVLELAENWKNNKEIKAELGKEWTSADREVLSDRASAELIRYAAWILKEHGGKPGSAAAATIFKGMNEKRQIIQQTLGKEYVTWKDIIPEGYGRWQPWEGTTFFMAHSVAETVAKNLLEGELEKIDIGKDDLRKGLQRGGRRREYVLHERVIATLNHLSSTTDRGTTGNAHAWAIKHWKIWQLVSPRRFAKYNFRNLTGDAEAAFVGSPAIFKRTVEAWNDLWEVFVEGKDPEKVGDGTVYDWLERGGWGATLQAQEMGEFDVAKPFFARHGTTQARDIPAKAWKAYWQTARISTDFREALLRYAAYKEALRKMEESKDGLPTDYWASIPGEIQGLEDIKDRAFWMSNDLLGAYDRVSVMGQELRERWFPFWSWKAVNFMRYVQLAKNAANDGELTKKIGYAAAGKLAKTPFIAMRIGKFVLKAMALSAIIGQINGRLFPREEEDLPEDVRGRPHIVFGRDADGNVQYFPRVGMLGDFAEWFGMDASPYYINQWTRGRMTLGEIAKDMAKSPVNVVIQGGVPFIKLGFELFTHQALFPDVFKPRTIRDGNLHIARSFGLENEYLALSGKPSRPYYETAKGVFIYTVDPFQAAFRDIMDEKTRYMDKLGKYGTGFWLNDRGNALYNARLALRFNDKEAAYKYMGEYLKFGGTLRGLKQSLQRMHPLSGLNRAEKIQFVAGLDARGLAQLVRSLKFYEELLSNATPEEKRATRLKFKGKR